MGKNNSAERVTKMEDAAINEVLQPTQSMMYQGSNNDVTFSMSSHDMVSGISMDFTTIAPYVANSTEDYNGSASVNGSDAAPMLD